jgi:hypothetical protein
MPGGTRQHGVVVAVLYGSHWRYECRIGAELVYVSAANIEPL